MNLFALFDGRPLDFLMSKLKQYTKPEHHATQMTFVFGYNPPVSKHVYLLKPTYIHIGSLEADGRELVRRPSS